MRSIKQIISSIGFRLYYYCCPDKIYLNNKFREVFGRNIDWKNPTTFNEKIQWLKIYDRNPLYTKLVDKYEVRKYIAEKIGEEYLIPCLGVWERFEDINFDELPNQFVLKCTHDSNSVVICRNKASFDVENAKKKLNKHLKINFYYNVREWPYKNVKARIIAEKYMEDASSKSLTDYKFFCFSGQPQFVYCSEGLEDHSTAQISFYDFSGKELPFHRTDYEQYNNFPGFPPNYAEMTKIATILSRKIRSPFVRIDLYSINGKIYFSEITFSPCGGTLPFDPPEWDEKLGERIDLSAL